MLYEKARKIILRKLLHVYGPFHLETFFIPELSVHQFKMVIDSIIPIGLDLDIPHVINTYQLELQLVRVKNLNIPTTF